MKKEVTKEELQKLQESVNKINNLQMQIGGLEAQKHETLHELSGATQALQSIQKELEDWSKFGVEGHEKAANPWISYHEIFTDDIQQALSERNLRDVHLDSKKQTQEDILLLQDYVFKKLIIFVNGTKQGYDYIGLQYDIDRVKLYLEITNVSSFEQVEIENKILFDTFEDQQNIIHVKTPESRRSLVLDKENPKGLLKF